MTLFMDGEGVGQCQTTNIMNTAPLVRNSSTPRTMPGQKLALNARITTAMNASRQKAINGYAFVAKMSK
jgi:hypothetical protein